MKMLAGGVLKATEKASQIIETWKVLETAATEVYERRDTENVTVWTPVYVGLFVLTVRMVGGESICRYAGMPPEKVITR